MLRAVPRRAAVGSFGPNERERKGQGQSKDCVRCGGAGHVVERFPKHSPFVTTATETPQLDHSFDSRTISLSTHFTRPAQGLPEGLYLASRSSFGSDLNCASCCANSVWCRSLVWSSSCPAPPPPPLPPIMPEIEKPKPARSSPTSAPPPGKWSPLAAFLTAPPRWLFIAAV